MATGPLRDVFAWIAITLGGHKKRLDRATRDFLVPTIQKRLQEKSVGQDITAKYRDCLQYIIDAPPSRLGDDDPIQHSYQLLHLTFASTSAPGLLVCHALIQLLMFPEYLQPLRNESRVAVAEHNGWTDKAMSAMVLMDSFLRETMRMYPAGSREFLYLSIPSQPSRGLSVLILSVLSFQSPAHEPSWRTTSNFTTAFNSRKETEF